MSEPELKEFCGVTAIYSAKADAAPLTHRALFALQHRGQESAGIVTIDESGRLHQLRARGLVTEALPLPRVCKLPGRRAIGHVRYSTVAADRAENVQPFLASTPYGEIAVAHNGNIKNAAELAGELRHAGSILSTTMDTELLVHLLARSGAAELASALQHPALKGLLPMPPVFADCSQPVSAADEAAATSLYWSVIQLDQPLVDLDGATAVLEQAVRHNPWVGEPQMVLARLYLSAGRSDDAVRAAESALQLFSAWGNSWDKRVAWDAWIAWTRILLQSAQKGTWPERLDKLNNLALKPEA